MIIIGSGMISAYLLESKISKYPRITISKNAIEKVQSNEEIQGMLSELLFTEKMNW